jgi:hypothetical protein
VKPKKDGVFGTERRRGKERVIKTKTLEERGKQSDLIR